MRPCPRRCPADLLAAYVAGDPAVAEGPPACELIYLDRLIRHLGRGGFAEVYLGEHLYLNTKAAIKVLQTRLSGSDLPGFIKEARTIAGLSHPHIIRVLDFGLEDETPFLVMEYAPNGTLRQHFPKGTRLPLTTILPFVKQMA